MAILGIVTAGKAPFMARDAVLVRLQTAVFAPTMTAHRQNVAQGGVVIAATLANEPLLRAPAEWQVTCADHFDKVHVVEG